VFRELLIRRISDFCQLTSAQVDQLEQHYGLMLRWNKTINLTRIVSVEEAVDRHYAESLFLGSNLPAGPLSIGDVGSGAGFPGFPVAVLRPECSVALIESHQRKAVFLKEASRGIVNLSVLSRRAEEVSRRFDWIISRAVRWDDVCALAPKLAPNVAFLGAEGPTGNSDKADCGRSIALPWDPDGKLIIVSRETMT
jgi:16S rRNA (guanine527-N7)-methyltransferase